MKTRDELDRLSSIILDSAITVHKEMGPGLLESVYQHCLITELKFRGCTLTRWSPYLYLIKAICYRRNT
jgi:GxxExxY protein